MGEFELNTGRYKQSSKRTVGLVALVVVLLGATAAGVWFWQQREIKALRANQNAAAPAPQIADKASDTSDTTTSTANWSQVSLEQALPASTKQVGVSFKLPQSWSFVSCGTTESLVAYLSPTTVSQTICGTEKVSPVVLSAQSGDIRGSYNYSDTATYKDAKTEKVNIAGKEFQLNSGVVDKPLEFGPPAGSTLRSYVFFDSADKVTYGATYVQSADDEDDLSADFKSMIEKTLAVGTISQND